MGLDEEPAAAAGDAAPPSQAEGEVGEADVRSLLRTARFDRMHYGSSCRSSGVEARVVNEVVERKDLALEQVSSPSFWEGEAGIACLRG